MNNDESMVILLGYILLYSRVCIVDVGGAHVAMFCMNACDVMKDLFVSVLINV